MLFKFEKKYSIKKKNGILDYFTCKDLLLLYLEKCNDDARCEKFYYIQ